MNKRFISMIIVSALSISILAGCGNNKTNDENVTTPPSQEENITTEDSNADEEDTSADTITDESNETENIDEDITKKVENKFTEAIDYLYNRDYSDSQSLEDAKEYITNNFTEDSIEEMISVVENYGIEVSYSDLLITGVKEIENSTYKKAFDIRYNISVFIGKGSIYSDIIGTVVEDNDGNILIQSINEGNF